MKNKKKSSLYYSCAVLSLTACTGKETKTLLTHRLQMQHRLRNPVLRSTIYSSRKTSCLQIIRMNGTKHLLWQTKALQTQAETMGDYLADLVDSNKDEFTEEELKFSIKISKPFVESKKNCSTGKRRNPRNTAADSSDADTPFKNFSATDYDGNKVDDSLFSNNAVTVLNFWFTGCKPCVGELSKPE